MVASCIRLVLCGKAILIGNSLHLLPGYWLLQTPGSSSKRSNRRIAGNAQSHDPFLVDDKGNLVMGFNTQVLAHFSRNGDLSLAGHGRYNFFHLAPPCNWHGNVRKLYHFSLPSSIGSGPRGAFHFLHSSTIVSWDDLSGIMI